MDKIEPVAWMYADKSGIFQLSVDKRNPDAAYWTETPLYAHPSRIEAQAKLIEALQTAIPNLLSEFAGEYEGEIDTVVAARTLLASIKEPPSAD